LITGRKRDQDVKTCHFPDSPRAKGLQRKKTADDSQEIVDVSKESEPEPVKRKTASRRVVKKKVTISADDNIISNDPDVALELGKSISKTKAEEAEAASSRMFQLLLQMNKKLMILCKLSKKVKRPARDSQYRGSSEGTSTIPEVLDESTVVSATSSEGTGTKPGVLDEEKDITKENVILEWGSEQESKYLEEDQIGDKEKDDKDDYVDDKGDDYINDNQDSNDEDAETKSDEDEIYKYKIRVCKDEDVEITVKDTTYAEINTLLEVKILLDVPHIHYCNNLPLLFVSTTPLVPQQITTLIPTPPLIIDAPTITIVSESDALSVQIPELPKNQTPTVDLEQKSKKSPLDILKIKKEQDAKQKMLKFTIKYIDKATLKEFDLKSALYQTMHANKSFKKNPINHRLYHALMKALIEDKNAIDKGVADIVKDHKRKHDHDEDDDDEDPPYRPNQGKKTKRRRTKESESFKKLSTTKDTPKGKAPSKSSKTRKTASTKERLKNLLRQVVLDQPEQSWFNQKVTAIKDPLTFNDLMTTLIDLSNIEIEYHFQECFNALTDKIDWNNPEGDHYPFDMSKPLPLQGHPGHQTVVADYFFNNDLEYLKSSDPERTYTTSVTKTKAAWYKIKGIEYMVPMLWSPTKLR
nr:hypothetical protein [Tanacetum cinerariifolium]